jgi:hypothetical protein
MSMTILVPDREWLRTASGPRIVNLEMHYPRSFDRVIGQEVIVVPGRPEEFPELLRFLPLSRVDIVKNNSPLTKAVDGLYDEIMGENLDIHVFARVETYVMHGVIQQHLRVWGPDLDRVSVWFDELPRGKKNEFCVNPAPLPEQPLSLQVLQTRDAALRKVGEMLGSDLGRYEDLAWLERDLKEIQAILAGVDRDRVAAKLRLVLNVVRETHGTDVPLYHVVTDLRDVLGFTETSLYAS